MTVMDNEDPALPETTEGEAWYDAEIAPALAALAKRCHERGMAFVVRAPGVSPSEDELVAWARYEMATFKVPRRVAFVDALPLNASGKVAKDDLRALARENRVTA